MKSIGTLEVGVACGSHSHKLAWFPKQRIGEKGEPTCNTHSIVVYAHLHSVTDQLSKQLRWPLR